MIELRNVTKLYGVVIGVNDITLDLPGGAYGLLGPNGSGKTTLLNLVTGQLWPTLGTVRVLGQKPPNSAELFRRIGVCPSPAVLLPNVTAAQWVRYLVELHGIGRRQSREMAEQALEVVGLKEAMHRAMGGYSHGMQQRTKLAQALAHEPELLILDEPFNGLDPVGRHDLSNLLKNWVARGRSLIFASHLLHEVEAITQSFLLISGGRLLASGTSHEIHTLLTDVPSEIHIRCNDPRALSQRLLAESIVDCIRIEGVDTLVVATTRPLGLYEHLPQWISGTGLRIHEIRSADESLQSLFGTLMKIHRGAN
jgi:ABC-2 type transport system ATP-binding protein